MATVLLATGCEGFYWHILKCYSPLVLFIIGNHQNTFHILLSEERGIRIQEGSFLPSSFSAQHPRCPVS